MSSSRKIAVLCGGDGREREVSLRSGRAVCDALKEANMNAEYVDLKTLNEVDILRDYDAVFIAMHGDWGEGGELQKRLEAMKIAYTGSGPKASSLAMDKWKACEIFRDAGLRIPRGILLPNDVSELGKNIVVKPCSGGSTVGITILNDATQEKLNSAYELAIESYEGKVMAEEYIFGREFTCAVWEHDGKIEALPVIEIVPHHGFYDYTNKYTSGATEYIVPAIVDDEIAECIADFAVRAHKSLGCSDYSRSDFRITPEGEVYILEVNTAPGMTATSLVPKAANAIGISMSEFVSEIMRKASFGKA